MTDTEQKPAAQDPKPSVQERSFDFAREILSSPTKAITAIALGLIVTVFGIFVFPGNSKLSDLLVAQMTRSPTAPLPVITAPAAAPTPAAAVATSATSSTGHVRHNMARWPYVPETQCLSRAARLVAELGYAEQPEREGGELRVLVRGLAEVHLRCRYQSPIAHIAVAVIAPSDAAAGAAMDSVLGELRRAQGTAVQRLASERVREDYPRDEFAIEGQRVPFAGPMADCLATVETRMRAAGFAIERARNVPVVNGRLPYTLAIVTCQGSDQNTATGISINLVTTQNADRQFEDLRALLARIRPH
jgi:hypothetical protein